MLIDSIAPRSSAWTAIPVDGGCEDAISIDAFLCRGGSPKPLAMIVAGVHGDEYEGPAAVSELATRLRPEVMLGSVIAIPVANPMAFRAAQRTTPVDGLNLARTFPGRQDGTPTERLAARLFDLVAEVDCLIDLHSGGVEYCFLPLAGFYGSVDRANRSFESALRFGLPVLWQIPGMAGVLSFEAWKRDIVAFGAEYLGAGRLSAEGTARYVRGVLSCLALWQICPNHAVLPRSGQVYSGDWEIASCAGLFHSSCQPGDSVTVGQELAVIRDTRGTLLETFVARSAGTVLAVRSKAYIQPGSWAVLVAERHA